MVFRVKDTSRSLCYPVYVVTVFHLVKQSAKPLGFLFVFVNMGPYGTKNFTTLLLLQIAAESFQAFPYFLPNGPHKNTFGIFDILKIENLTNLFVFVNMGPNGSENFKTLLLLQIAAKSFNS